MIEQVRGTGVSSLADSLYYFVKMEYLIQIFFLFSKKKGGGFDMEKEICGIKEIAKYLNISESGVRKLVREKRIPYFKVLSCIKFDINIILY